jgi:monoamine oxidase
MVEKDMLDTAIVGGGLSGLALAHGLLQQGRTFALYEARDRLGGRILTQHDGDMALDMGPAWFWPKTQPRMARMVVALGLVAFPQHDQGQVLRLHDPDKAPEVYVTDGIHQGAQRLVGGMARLVQALAATLPDHAMHPAHALVAVIKQHDHVELHFRCGDGVTQVLARRVVLTAPPRVLEETVRFDPPLDDVLRQRMRATQAWMANQAKALVTFPHPFWRTAGLAGNAFVEHEQAMLYEVFDACDAAGERAALGGFIALTPELRTSFQTGMPLLIESQLMQLFGSEADQGVQHIQDWANEPYTCSTLDRMPSAVRPLYDDASLRRSFWDASLYFGGSETAGYAAGYLEGALEASERIVYLLTHQSGTVHALFAH